MSLTDEERNDIVTYRYEKSDQAFDEAIKVENLDMHNLAANRLYYALYYAASATLVSHGYVSHSHSGMLTMMHLHFVKSGLLTKDDGALLSRMFSLRQESDYEDFVEVSKRDIEELMPLVRILIEKIKRLKK